MGWLHATCPEGSKVKFIPVKNILTGLKGDILFRKYRSGGGSLDGLKQGAKQTRPMHWRTNTNLYPTKRQPTKASGPMFDLGQGAQCQICPHQKILSPSFPIGWFHIANL